VALSAIIVIFNVYTDHTIGRKRHETAIWMTFFLILLAALFGIFGYELIADRAQNVASGMDYSTTYRTYGSLAVAIEVLKKYPLFGVGAGSLMPIKDLIFQTYFQLGVPLTAIETDWNLSINNALASFLIYFGLIGTSIAGLLFWRIFASDIKAPRTPLVVALIAYSLSCGAVYTPKFIIAVMVLIAIAKLRPPPSSAAQTAAAQQRNSRSKPNFQRGRRVGHFPG
jgi:hypothetical protein